ncbi:MAG: threonine/serine dehydratase [Planctomycetes bacterium]|nr:threonine/serine dehydratase [Planctomycetota bacterium]
MSATLPVSIADVEESARRLAGVAHRTPLLRSHTLDALAGRRVLLKPENFQKTGSFKIRGAFAALSRLTPEERARGVITYSSGNHGQALAYAARRLECRAIVVMPENASPAKVDAARAYGADVRFKGTTSEARGAEARRLVAEHGYTLVPPFDDPRIVAGQGTIALEILEDAPDVSAILAPVGGGGLIAGIALAAKSRKPSVRVFGVEPTGADALHRSLAEHRLVKIATTDTIADGLRPQAPGQLNFEIASRHLDGVLRVDDDAILRAMRFLLERMKILVEPSGAAALAAVLEHRDADLGDPVAVVLSGGNVEMERLAKLL